MWFRRRCASTLTLKTKTPGLTTNRKMNSWAHRFETIGCFTLSVGKVTNGGGAGISKRPWRGYREQAGRHEASDGRAVAGVPP